MPKINVNGNVREMTVEELEDIKNHIPPEVKESFEERLKKLEVLLDRFAPILEKMGVNIC